MGQSIKTKESTQLRLRGVLVPFFQNEDGYETKYLIATEDGREFGLLANEFTEKLQEQTWSIVDVLGQVVLEKKGHHLLLVEKLDVDESVELHEDPFAIDFDDWRVQP